MPEQAWIKSSYSGSQANCVEVTVRDRIMVRDIKDRTGRVLRFTPRPGASSPATSRRTRRRGPNFPRVRRPATVS
jgi:hypothetical protein